MGLCTALVQAPPHLLLPAHPGPKARRLLLPEAACVLHRRCAWEQPGCHRSRALQRQQVPHSSTALRSPPGTAPLSTGAAGGKEPIPSTSPARSPAPAPAPSTTSADAGSAGEVGLPGGHFKSCSSQKPEHPVTNPGLTKPRGILLGMSRIRVGSVHMWGDVM